MNTKQENIQVDSCQYTPVYLVENTGAIQGRSFILTQANAEEPKPVTDNLKRYYENSGILETSFVNNTPTFSKPRILKRQENKLVGNNLKLASFLLPKSSSEINVSKQTAPVNSVPTTPANNVLTTPVNNVHTTPVNNVQSIPVNNVHSTPVNNVVYKPVVTSVVHKPVVTTSVVHKPVVTTSVVHTVPKVEVERKIVRLTDFPTKIKPTIRERVPPKFKPKDDPPNPNPIKHTSVQLLKLGETYHSLNQLSDDQMKMVNQALKIFSNPENGAMEPTYDPVTNTRFIYKVVSPRDLTVVGKNKLKREEIRKEEIMVKEIKKEPKKIKEEEVEPEPPVTVREEVKVTRSGRKVKFPKQIVEEIPVKPKKKNGAVVSCFQCSTEFCSLYRLQKHYENHPTHIPAKIHSNLFHCLLAIIKSGSEEDRTNIFIQQLEQLIEKLKSLLPCLLKKIDGVEGKPCTINDNIGRLFGMNPGKYNLNMDGLTCVRDKDGNCRHNPPPPKNNYNLDLNQMKTSPHCHTIQHEQTANESESEDCARINAVDKWPIANKRFKKIKQQKQAMNAKRMKLVSESAETVIELDDFIICNHNFTVPIEETANNVQPEEDTLLDNFINKESENYIQHQIVTMKDTQKNTTVNDLPTFNAVDRRLIANRRPRKVKLLKTQELNPKTIKLTSDITDTTIDLDEFVICDGNFTIPMEHNTDNVQTEAISLLDNYFNKESDNGIQQPIVVVNNTQMNTAASDLVTGRAVDKRPIANRILKNYKQKKMQEMNAKKVKLPSDQIEKAIELDNYVICDDNYTIPIENNANNGQPDAISLLDNFIHKESEQPTAVATDTQKSTSVTDFPKKAKGAHTQFHSAHFDIRSSPIKSSSAATFRKFQINPEKLAKYQVQIIRPLELDKNSEEVSPNTEADNVHNASADIIPNTEVDIIHNTEPKVVQNSEEVLPEDSAIPSNPDDNSILQSIFRDDLIELTCKDPNDIPNDLAFAAAKEWISSGLNSVDEKSDDGFIKANSLDESFIRDNSLIEPALLHCKEDSHDKLTLGSEITAADHLSGNDNHILNQGSASVLNFLDSLGSECLSYPETEIRNNNVDFQLDLFSFSNT